MAEEISLEPSAQGWRLVAGQPLHLQDPGPLLTLAYAWLSEDHERRLNVTYADGTQEQFDAPQMHRFEERWSDEP
ncbi:MAG: hypothetical protein ABI577_06570 [bacterium]